VVSPRLPQVFSSTPDEVNDELGALEEGLASDTARPSAAGVLGIAFIHWMDRIVRISRDRSREWLDKPEWPAPQRNRITILN